MKRAIVLGLILFLMLALNATEKLVLGSQPNSVRVVSSTNTETILEFTIGNYNQNLVEIDGSTWYHVSLPKEGITQDKGMPELPVFNRSIVIDAWRSTAWRFWIPSTRMSACRLLLPKA